MNEVNNARDKMAIWAKSLFDRGLTNGSSGNISMRLSNGNLLVTPTGSSLGFLDPSRISLLSKDGKLLDGDLPTKEMPLHSAFYETRQNTGAVVHLHSSYCVLLSLLPDIDPDSAMPPITAYSVMRLGHVKLLPFFVPGDPAMGNTIRKLQGKHSAVLLANHGPVVAGPDLDSAIYAMEELEETAKLVVLCRSLSPKLLDESQISAITQKFQIDY